MKKRIVILLISIVSICNIAYAQKYKYGKVSKEELEEKFYALDSVAEAAFLYKNKSVRFDYNIEKGFFEKIEEVFLRIKIYNKEGFKHGNQKILFYNPEDGKKDNVTNIKAVTYNLINGKIEKQKVKKNEIYLEEKNKYYSYKKIPFPNIKEGSVIELKYTITSNYYYISPFWVQEDVPTKKLKYSTRIPEYYNFKSTVKGYHLISPKKENISGVINFGQEVVNYRIEKCVFEDDNIPALKNDEPFTSNYENYRGIINMELASYQFPGGYLENVSNSWEDVCAKLDKSYSFGHELKKSSYFKSDLEKIITTAGNDDSVKMLSIYDFVKSKVKWNGYNSIYTNDGVSKAYKKGEGNVCEVNLILISMLRHAGLNAHPILLSTKKHGVPLFPTLDGLNYVVAGVESEEGKVTILDATEVYSSVNDLPTRAMNWNGRMMISGGKNISIPLVPKNKSEEFYIANLSFDENFKLSGKVMAKYTKHEALKFRNRYNTLSDEKLKEKLESKFHVDLESFEITNKQNIYKPVLTSLNISSDKYCETINEKKYINPLLFFKETKNPFKLETRKYPIDLITPFKQTKTVMFKIPEGYKVVSAPKGIKVQMNDDIGSYTFLITIVGNSVTVKSIKQFNKSTVPVSRYDELKDMYKNILSKNKEKIVLEKITEDTQI